MFHSGYNVYGGHLWTSYKTPELNKFSIAFNDIYRTLISIETGTSISSIYVNNKNWLKNIPCMTRDQWGFSNKSEFNTAKMFWHGVNLDLTCARLLMVNGHYTKYE